MNNVWFNQTVLPSCQLIWIMLCFLKTVTSYTNYNLYLYNLTGSTLEIIVAFLSFLNSTFSVPDRKNKFLHLGLNLWSFLISIIMLIVSTIHQLVYKILEKYGEMPIIVCWSARWHLQIQIIMSSLRVVNNSVNKLTNCFNSTFTVLSGMFCIVYLAVRVCTETVRYLINVRLENGLMPSSASCRPRWSSGTWVTPTHHVMQSEQTARLGRFWLPGWVVTITI